MTRSKRVLFVQYTNPGAYPPLEHASHILAERGWKVTFLGIRRGYSPAKRFLAPHPNIEIREFPPCAPGWRQKFHYAAYCLWVWSEALKNPAPWVYASDPFAAPAALVLVRLFGRKAIYHEHDAPSASGSAFLRAVGRARVRLARAARLCVLPNEERARLFEAETKRPALTVWNCPLAEEARPARPAETSGEFWAHYQGSIVPDRLPMAVVEAFRSLPPRAGLRICGYETIGHAGYVERLLERAKELGLAERVRFIGAAPQRDAMLEWARHSQVGLTLMPLKGGDVNMRHMTGASNKPFEYLACGMPLLVSELDDWKRFYADAGYGLACDPGSPESVAAALRWFLEHPEETREMGERGRAKIAAEWNYEKQFESVARLMEA